MTFRFALLPLLSILLLIEIAGGVLRSPFLSWNEIRLCRALAVARGLPLYPGHDSAGGVIGTLHTPISHVFFIPAALLPDPTAAILAGSFLAVLAVFVPLAWVLFRNGPAGYAMFCFLFAAFLLIQSPGTYHVLFFIHADAPAVGLATLGCGLLMRPAGWKRSHFWLAGVAAAASVGCKQTMAPVVFAVALYLLVAVGWRAMVHFLGASAVAGAFLLTLMLTVWPAHDVLFNIWTLASSRPMKAAALPLLMESYRSTRLDALPALLPLLFLSAYTWRSNIRQFALENRWLVFALCGLFMLPVSLKAMVTIGSGINHFGVVLYFFFAAAALALQTHLTDQDRALRLSTRFFLALGILVGLAPGLVLTLVPGVRNLRGSPLHTAIAYNHKHPGRAYFPWNPAVGLLDDHRLYHLDPALYDREAVGYGLTRQQLESGLPKQFDIVAVPPGEQLTSWALLELTATYHPVIDPELPGWTVFAK
jgi:hypothetical protein